MNQEQMAALAVGAVLVFWMVGAYNRVMALRARIGQAWQQIDEPLKRRKETVPLLVGALREAWPNEQSALDAVLSAQGQAAGAADAVRAKPAAAAAAAALAVAEGQLTSAMARLRALLEQHPELREREDIAGWLHELQEADQRRAFARQLFNDAVAAYNSAAHQWPTRALAWAFAFEDAGVL